MDIVPFGFKTCRVNKVKIACRAVQNFIKVDYYIHTIPIQHKVETMPKAKYRGLTLQRELIDRIEEYIKTHPERGYKSLADFVTEAVRKRCEELKILVPKPEPPPLEHFNINEDHVTVIDHRARMLADVYFKGNRVFCELCKAENCEHVKYALDIPKVQQLLRKKGWIIEEGEITQKPY